jgi:uncharacterized alpha-E superfamily protein
MPHTKPLLSRVADAVYWLGRYIERAENVARFLDVNHNLMLDLPHDYSDQWQPIVDTTGDRAPFLERYGSATKANVVRFLAFDPENPNSIYSCILLARENARSVRETISSEMWQQINSLYLMITAESRNSEPPDLPTFCHQVRMGCHLIHGILHVTMSHNEAWQFIRLGTLLERADKTTRILDVKYFILLPSVSDVGTPYDDVQWSAVLKSVSGFEMYRKRHGRIAPERIVEFLLLDNEFPRSFRYCISLADRALHYITGVPVSNYSCPSEQRLGLLRSELDFTAVDAILAGGLHEFCDAVQTKMNTIDECISGDFFAQRPLAADARA